MDWKQETEAKAAKKKVLGKRLIQGENLLDIVEENPEMLFELKRIQGNLEVYHQLKARQKPDCGDFIENNWDILMHYDDHASGNKKRHWWIWSTEPNRGKTKFLERCDANYRCSWYNKSEVYQQVHQDSQFILVDEYTTPDLKVTVLNQMCDGHYPYPVKGGAPINSKANLIICGNKSPAEMYPNAWKYVEARFNVLNLDEAYPQENKPVEWPPILNAKPAAQVTATKRVENPFAKKRDAKKL